MYKVEESVKRQIDLTESIGLVSVQTEGSETQVEQTKVSTSKESGAFLFLCLPRYLPPFSGGLSQF